MVKQMAIEGQGNENRTTKIVKTTKVPTWTKQIALEAYLKALQVWMDQNKKMSENTMFYEEVE